MLKLDLNLEELSKIVKKEKANQFLIELPEGLKHNAFNIISNLKKTGKKFVLSIDTTYGACDLYETELKKANCQAIIHFGHTKFVLKKIKQNVIYWPCYYKYNSSDIKHFVKDIENKFSEKKVTIVGPIQYKNVILETIKMLNKNKKVKVINGKKTRLLEKTQILGCNTTSIKDITNKVDAVIYFGDGNFHFEALKNFKTYKYLVYKGFEELKENSKKPNYDAIFLNAKNIGIYVSSKIGQNKIKIAENIAQKIGHLKKNSIILYGNELNNNKLLGLNIDLLINTACPRISDDYKNYSLAIINYKEFLEIYQKYC